MVHDFPDIMIAPRKERGADFLPQRCLLVANPAEFRLVRNHAEQRGCSGRRLHTGTIFVDPAGRYSVAGPALGAPAAALLLEQLIAYGVRQVWLFSCCGSIDPGIGIGALFIPDAAIVGEGLSGWYSGGERVFPDQSATEEITVSAAAQRLSFGTGVVWSTDAPFRERRSTLLSLRERFGVSCVDMECSALCSVAAFRKIALGALFVVSDELWTERWKPGFSSEDFRFGVSQAIELVFESDFFT